ncbi:fibronectin type III domain-containing protein [Alistipes sp.]|uniref:golvesin C-terminal-like domain-containing protein n=1 Tax=Alistipes sp. TaxID=1872444 RepID=UPI003AB4F2FD
MKNRILYFLISIFALSGVTAAEIGTATRAEIARTLSRIVSREVTGGYQKAEPTYVRIQAVKASRSRVQIYTTVGLSYYPFREDNVQALRDSVRALLPQEFRKACIELYSDQREIGELVPLACRNAAQLKKQIAKRQIVPFTNRSERPLVTRLSAAATPSQGLSGRHIALWQSHGRYFDQTENRWKWQRSMLWQTCEDLYTQSYVLPYLVPMLENAGACVMLPRERDVQKFEVLADNDDARQYAEEGGWEPGGPGFAHLRQVYHTGENPFRDGTTRRTRTVTGDGTARAAWRADIPERGEYAVYVSYESTPESADDAHYTVHHLGGETSFAVNQTMGGGTWIYLGRFSFAPGHRGVVTLSNGSRTAGRILSADGVKIGGGYGNIARTPCDSLRLPDMEYIEETSGYPRFCEGARYWLQWAGFPEEVYTPKRNTDDYKDDYMSRAHWVNALMGGSERLPDSVGLRIPVDMALAFHSDAGVRDGDGIVGTLGIYYTRENRGKFAGGADRYRSRDLTDLVQAQVVEDIRRTFEPGWQRRGLWNRAYYEARVPGVPTMLLELLSHQNFADMRLGSDPRFKFLVSRAVYKGILQYISSQYGLPYVVQPLPVEAFAAEFTAADHVVLSWSPVMDPLEKSAAPTGYVVYTRVDDGGFDNGRQVDKPYLIVEQQPGRIYSYRVTAVNEGGESFPSETLAVCRMPDEKGRVLIVNGFDRVSAPLSERNDSLAGFRMEIDGGVPDRQDIAFVGAQHVFDLAQARCNVDSLALGACGCDFETDVIGGNTFDYPVLHGRSAAAAGYSFCSASLKAVERGEAALEQYPAVDLILGKQRTTTIGRGVQEPAFATFSPELQGVLRRYLADGGALFASGAYVVSDLWAGDAPDEGRAFAEEVLHCTLDTGRAAERGRVRVVTSHRDFSRGEYRFNDEYRPDRYIVEAPDALNPAGEGAFSVMRYVENGRTAGVACEAEGRTFVVGFPFESILSRTERDRLMRDALKFLLPEK